jgi:hypothetical protein
MRVVGGAGRCTDAGEAGMRVISKGFVIVIIYSTAGDERTSA